MLLTSPARVRFGYLVEEKGWSAGLRGYSVQVSPGAGDIIATSCRDRSERGKGGKNLRNGVLGA
jgi:hypothetical protein